ncbi:hypothetical protein ACSQ67_003000 [Phaseolus vulgaris]
MDCVVSVLFLRGGRATSPLAQPAVPLYDALSSSPPRIKIPPFLLGMLPDSENLGTEHFARLVHDFKSCDNSVLTGVKWSGWAGLSELGPGLGFCKPQAGLRAHADR